MTPSMPSESEMAEAACYATDALGIDLSDPACFANAEATVRAAEENPCSFDVVAVGRFLNALKAAAAQRDVTPGALWCALDALERY